MASETIGQAPGGQLTAFAGVERFPLDANTGNAATDGKFALSSDMSAYFNRNNIVSVMDFGAKGDGLTDDTAAIQAAHDYVESKLGGYIALKPGATHLVNGGLIRDTRLVGIQGNGATLDFSQSTPVNVGADLVTGDNSTLSASTGSWTTTNAILTKSGSGIEIVTVGGTISNGDSVILTVTTTALAGSPISITYNVVTGDTTTTIAKGLAQNFNANSTLFNAGLVAVASSNVVYIYQNKTISPAPVYSKTNGTNATLTLSTGSSPLGAMLQNTSAVNGYAYLPITTVAGQWYAVTYTMNVVQGSTLTQTNVYASVTPSQIALNYSASATTFWFKFRAQAATTYLRIKNSTANIGDYSCISNIFCKYASPPGIWEFDRSNQFVNVVQGGTGYVIGDICTVQGGTSTSQASIMVSNVDGNGAVLSAIVIDDGTYTVFPTNPVVTTGGTGLGFTGNIGISTPQFGHEVYHSGNFLMKGAGKANYTVDSQTPLSVYSSASCAFGLYLDSPDISDTRNSTSSRGNWHNIAIRNFGAGVTFRNRAYLGFLNNFAISNCNFGYLVTDGSLAGENLAVKDGFVTGCDLNMCVDANTLKASFLSLDFPKQASIRVTGKNSILIMNECHIEQSPPGDSTQLVDPIGISGSAAQLILNGGELMVTGSYTAGWNQIISTTLGTQTVVFNNVQMNNLTTRYLVSGPAVVRQPAPARLLQFPSIPLTLNDQGAGSNAASMEGYGFGDFEVPAVATSTVPEGMYSIGSSIETYNTANNLGVNYNVPSGSANGLQTNRILLASSTAQSHSGAQSLKVTKKFNNPLFAASLYFLAPVRPGFQVWWTFFIKALSAASQSATTLGSITVSQNFTQLLGSNFLPVGNTVINGSSTFTSNIVTGHQLLVSGPGAGQGQSFAGNTNGSTAGIYMTDALGTVGSTYTLGGANNGWSYTGVNGWQFFSFDNFNHGQTKAPEWATHTYLRFTLDSFGDSVATSQDIAFFLDDLQCWRL